MTAPAQETGHEVPQSKEAYLKSFESEWGKIHQGRPPEVGLKKEGKAERKEICEDVKLKNREKGLFLVADGVSSQEGWYASRETARMMYEILGEELDRGVENNIQQALRDGEDPLDRITKYVSAQMITAVEQADSHIKAIGELSREFKGSATTLSMAKLMELPDGKSGRLQRLFFTNIGDSRIYVRRKGGVLKQVTRDDSLLQRRVDLQEVTPQDADIIDQAPDPRKLDPRLRAQARQRSIITKSVGIGKPTENLHVSYIDLQPGDRFVIVSDGVSDQMLTGVIASFVHAEPDDERAEAYLQNDALRMSLEGTHPRAKGDDISAIVKTIEECGPDRAYLHPETKRTSSRESLKESLRDIRLKREYARQEVHQFQEQLAGLDALTPKRERLMLMMKLEKARQQEATYGYHLVKTQLDIFESQIPPRFQMGERVDVWRDDFDPPSLDRQPWTVVAYDAQNKQYTVRGAGGASKEISRYELENVQSGLMVRLGDELPAVNELGVLEKGFTVVAFDKQGQVVLAKEANGVIKRVVANSENVNESFFGQLYVAEKARQRMAQSAEAYHAAVKEERSLKGDAEMIAMIENRQQAIDSAKKQG